MKGKDITKKSSYLYARFSNIEGLMIANPVVMNGLEIGSVYDTRPGDEDLNTILVTIRLDEQLNIPKNSIATVTATLLGSTSFVIEKGNATTYLKGGDTINTQPGGGFLGGIASKLEPTQKNLDHALLSADSLLMNVNEVLDAQSKANLRQAIANLNQVTGNLTQTTASINALLNAQNGALTKTLKNLEDFSASLSVVKEQLPGIMGNLQTTTQNLSQLELDKTLASVQQAMNAANGILQKAESPESTIGSLLNDRKLYNNINSTVNSLNLLMQDLRLSPKRYVNVSIFGKKDKSEPLMRPMLEDSVTQEQIRN